MEKGCTSVKIVSLKKCKAGYRWRKRIGLCGRFTKGSGHERVENHSCRHDGGGNGRDGDDMEGKRSMTSFFEHSLEINIKSRISIWFSTFYRTDPRWQIMKVFNEVASGDSSLRKSNIKNLTFFRKEDLFTVWRPTSKEAIKKMMLGEAVGKGMDIKGKSAKRGNISSYVPFLQVYEEKHKAEVQMGLRDDGVVRIYYGDEICRDQVIENLLATTKSLLRLARKARETFKKLSDGIPVAKTEQELALQRLKNNNTNLRFKVVDEFKPNFYGLDVSERLFWEAYAMEQDFYRPEGTKWDIGRTSNVHAMMANFTTTRESKKPGNPKVVMYQKSSNPMEPRMLLASYEENRVVRPVVSDFDCFLIGSRGLKYDNKISNDHIKLLQWLVRNIGDLLYNQKRFGKTVNWPEIWPKVVRRAALLDGFYPCNPKYGHADPTSYAIMKHAAERLQKTGCVRHGPECFNFHNPQEMDDHFLVICSILPGKVPWNYMKVKQLQDFLIDMIEDGFSFPINPKWILCDPGWKKVYNKLRSSKHPNIQQTLNCWFPPETGILEEIDKIISQYPHLLNEGKMAAMEEKEFLSKPYSKREIDRELVEKIRSKHEMVMNVNKKKMPLRKVGIEDEDNATNLQGEDLRLQIMQCFHDAASNNRQQKMQQKVNVFTVWRPVSAGAISKMQMGNAVGKGLEVKGRSASKGNLTSFVPFLQIHRKEHVNMAWNSLNNDQVFRIFYENAESRNKVVEQLLLMKEYMLYAVRIAENEFMNATNDELRVRNRMCNETELKVTLIDDSITDVYGLDVSELLFWEAYAMKQDCSRPKGSEWDAGIQSSIGFMQFNFDALRRRTSFVEPRRVVVYQMNTSHPMEPRTLVMAYEEDGNVRLLVEDFDCFTLGTHGVQYEDMPQNQIELMEETIQKIGEILDSQNTIGKKKGWNELWLDVLEDEESLPQHEQFFLKGMRAMPQYGFGDTKSYSIFTNVIERLQSTGCIRHCAECFNLIFPQIIDDDFLLISDDLPGHVPWKYVKVEELQDYLCSKIDEGFTFPLNPKWILCDQGWKKVYDKLLLCDNPNIQDSLNCWFPLSTGIREEIDRISKVHPHGFLENNDDKMLKKKWDGIAVTYSDTLGISVKK